MAEKGNLSINSENMFPIIKKWLYSDHDIFFRELISNGCDAITKLKKLEMMGETELPDGFKGRIDVVVDPDAKTIAVTDNGLGMTADEVKKYINNIAFSGAAAFMEKYKDKANNDQIIGHFGLGFYSAFMVSDLVEIDTLSYQKDAKAVHWTCDGSSEYEIEDSDRTKVGTTVTLHVTDDCLQFCNFYGAEEVIRKYCGFMPYEIYLFQNNTTETEIIKESERRPDDVVIEEVRQEENKDEKKDEDKKDEKPKEKEFKIRKRPELMNDINPLWNKTPKDCTDEEYKDFYRKVFNDYREPLFWIHLNMDYPYHLKGILYFPKINLHYENAEGCIKLYNNQVFVADNIKEVIPEYLLVLRGVIDCPDLPLNVSRSALQNDGFAQKISDYITKKVCDKLSGMCKPERETYEKYWDDISIFIKYGCLKDEKFNERMANYCLLKDLDGKYHTIPDALEINQNAGKDEEKAVDENGKKVDTEIIGADGKPISSDEKKEDEKKDGEKPAAKEKTIYYVTDPEQQGQYIRMFRNAKLQAFVMDSEIDPPFINALEAKHENIHFERIDAAVDEAVKGESSKEKEDEYKKQSEELQKIARKVLNNESLTVNIVELKDADTASMLTVDESNRRYMDMMKMYSNGMNMFGDFAKEGQTLVLNAKHPLVTYVLGHENTKNGRLVIEQLYDLAKIQNAPLSADEMTAFITRTNKITEMMAESAQDSDVPPIEDEKKDEDKDKQEAQQDEQKAGVGDAAQQQ